MKKSLLIAFCALLSLPSFAGHEEIFLPVREGTSNYVSPKEFTRAQKKFKDREGEFIQEMKIILSELAQEGRDAGYDALLSELMNIYSKNFNKGQIGENELKEFFLNALVILRGNNIVDDVFYRLVQDYVKKEFPIYKNGQKIREKGPALELPAYLSKKAAFNKNFLRVARYRDEIVKSTEPNPFPLKRYKFSVNGRGRLSLQERLFYLYEPKQILEMATIINFTLSVADAKKIFTTIEFRDSSGPLVLTHSPTEQYRLALRLMRMKKNEAETNPNAIGVQVSDLDLIGSAYLMGIISHDELELIVNNPDFYLPQISFSKKVMTYIGQLLSLGVRIHPATAPYAILPLVLYNSYVETQEALNKVDEESFIFNLPARKR